MAKITGIDVSEWQKSIDWAVVKSQIDFVILRKGTGKQRISTFSKTWKGVRITRYPSMVCIISFTP